MGSVTVSVGGVEVRRWKIWAKLAKNPPLL
jgi:hypothetical protein